MHTERYIEYVNLFNNNLSGNIYKFTLKYIHRETKILEYFYKQYKFNLHPCYVQFTFTLHNIFATITSLRNISTKTVISIFLGKSLRLAIPLRSSIL